MRSFYIIFIFFPFFTPSAQLTYSFDVTASNDVITKFALKTNGELWTTQPLDREEVSQYRVPIQVTDGVPGEWRGGTLGVYLGAVC